MFDKSNVYLLQLLYDVAGIVFLSCFYVNHAVVGYISRYVCSLNRVVGSVYCMLYSVHFILLYTPYSIQLTVYTTKYKLYCVYCMLYTIYSTHSAYSVNRALSTKNN